MNERYDDKIHVPDMASNSTGRLAASQPGEPSQPRCPKCGHGISWEIGDKFAMCNKAIKTEKGYEFHQFEIKSISDFPQFFGPSTPSPLPTYEQAKSHIGWGWSGFTIKDEDSLKFAFNRMRDAMQKCLGGANSGSAGQEPTPVETNNHSTQKGEKFRIVQVNKNCFKLYLFGHFIGSMGSEGAVRMREKSIADNINRYIDAEVRSRLPKALASHTELESLDIDVAVESIIALCANFQERKGDLGHPGEECSRVVKETVLQAFKAMKSEPEGRAESAAEVPAKPMYGDEPPSEWEQGHQRHIEIKDHSTIPDPANPPKVEETIEELSQQLADACFYWREGTKFQECKHSAEVMANVLRPFFTQVSQPPKLSKKWCEKMAIKEDGKSVDCGAPICTHGPEVDCVSPAHPLNREAYLLGLEIEKLPPSEQETKIITMLGDLRKKIRMLELAATVTPVSGNGTEPPSFRAALEEIQKVAVDYHIGPSGRVDQMRTLAYKALAGAASHNGQGCDTATELLKSLMLDLHYTLDIGGKLNMSTRDQMRRADEYLNSLVPKVALPAPPSEADGPQEENKNEV